MSNPKGNTIPRVISIVLLMFVIYCADLFLLKADRGILGDNFYARAASFVTLFIVLSTTKEPINILGISKKKKKILGGIVFGIIFSVIPLVLVTGIEYLFYFFTDNASLVLRFSPPNHTDRLPPAAYIAIYFVTSFFGSAFKEMFFRGYVLKTIKRVSDFKSANIVQAICYTAFILPLLLRNFILSPIYDPENVELAAFIVGFYLIHETLGAIKWGYLTRISGATYIATIDHTLYVFLANSIFITTRYVTWSFMLHMLAIQVVSFLMVMVYYKINMKLVAEKKAKEAAEKEEKRKARQIKHQQEIEAQIGVKTQDVNEISPNEYKDLVDEVSNKRRSHKRNSSKKNDRHSQANESKLESFDSEAIKKADDFLQRQLQHQHRSAKKRVNRNERHSKSNEAILDNFEDVDIAKKTDEFHNQRMSKHHHSSHREQRNDRHSQANAGKLESYDNVNVSQVADEKLKSQFNKNVQHRSKYNEKAAVSNEEKLEGFSAEEIAKKTTEYSSSLRMERKNSSHPHPHDKIAMDALLTEEQIEQANIEKIASFENDSIDDFLNNFAKEKESKSRHHHHHSSKRDASHAEYNDKKINGISDEFDVNEYLRDYHDKRYTSHHHRHHHSSSASTSQTAPVTETPPSPTPKPADEPKPKKGFFSKLKDLGTVDDNNDLI